MLDIIYAAETQFRLDSAQLDRDIARRVAIRDRFASEADDVSARRAPARAARTWPRPIGLAHAEPVCA
ncbi:hypothetical protein [Microbacterium ulmi]|uniref:Uncharacterized protein n=1 Tax=Microbacterium ulmi TaxID=179095 RepID=A0A7Y2Q326_9MICO|nr:hypothetical protein [Microbacterium ulmi]NII68842.1 hypothetical protein [Microbacterium ulmi]NNH05278.1 hypothetical protein [Microbacterium ulmi]